MTPKSTWTIHRYASLTSTMERAELFARLGAPERTIVQSVEQTAGRGRAGRSWHSPAGGAIYATIILRPQVEPNRLSTLPLLAGIAVAEAIESASDAPVLLKWPNDVWMGTHAVNHKVAGILAMSRLEGPSVEYVLIGIGINVSTPGGALPPGATSILESTGQQLIPDALLVAMLARFDAAYAAFLATSGLPSLDAWRARAALIGECVAIEESGHSLIGTHRGVDDTGALLLEVAAGDTRRIVAGDLVRGPISDLGFANLRGEGR